MVVNRQHLGNPLSVKYDNQNNLFVLLLHLVDTHKILHSFISYYDCYQSNNREFHIAEMYKKKT